MWCNYFKQNLLPNGGENMEFLEDRDQMNAILWSIIIAGACVIPVEFYYLTNPLVTAWFTDLKFVVPFVAASVGVAVYLFYIHVIVPYNNYRKSY